MTRAASLRLGLPGLVVLLGACISDVPPPALVPAGPTVTRVEDLSGDYCYYGSDFNVRSYRLGVDHIPFVDVAAFATPALVSVRATARRIVFRYTTPDGLEREEALDLVAGRDSLRGGALVLRSRVDVTLPLVFWGQTTFDLGSNESRLFRLRDGRLVMTDSIRSRGYSEDTTGHGMFYREERTVAVLLDPATGGCDADTTGRPLPPWFGLGPDLREPACVAQLEEQLTAILVAKREAPEVAATLARESTASRISRFMDGERERSKRVDTRHHSLPRRSACSDRSEP